MPVTAKCTFFMKYKSAGVSFSLYNVVASLEALTTARGQRGSIIDVFLQRYMTLLGAGVECPYVRISNEEVVGDSLFFDKTYITIASGIIPQTTPRVVQVKSADDDNPDAPNTAILISLAASTTQKGRVFQRFVPDNAINYPIGLNPDQPWSKAFDAWLAAVVADKWCIRALGDATAYPSKAITTITRAAPGDNMTVTTLANHGLNVGNVVRIGRNSGGKGVNGVWTVGSTPTTTTFTLLNSAGATLSVGTGGYVRQRIFQFPQITSGTYRRVTSRKAGRPFDVPRGRRPKVKS